MADAQLMQAPAAARLSNRWLVLVLLLGIALFNHGDRYLLAGLVEPIKAEFQVSDGFMGLLMGPAFAVLYSTLAIPLARYADHGSRITIICGGCLIWSFCTAMSGFATGPGTLALARIGVGVGEAAFQAPAYALLAGYFPPEQRGRAFAIMGMATYIGQTLGYVVGPAIAAESDWRLPFMVMGAGGMMIATVTFLAIREPPRTAVTTGGTPRLALMPLYRTLNRARSYRRLMIGMACGVLSGVSFGLWGPSLFARAYDVPVGEASTTFGLAFGMAGLAGMLIFGALSDRLTRRAIDAPVKLAGAALAAATLSILIATWMPTLGLARLMAIPSGLLGGGWSVGVIAGLQYLLPDRIRASGTALAMLVVNLAGFVIGPWFAGMLSDLIGGDPAQSLRLGLTLVIPVGFVGGWLLWSAGRDMAADRLALERVG
jgi:MFS family permease